MKIQITNYRFKSRLLTALIVFLITQSSVLFAQNLVTNGDFEAGYNSGWNHKAGGGGVAVYSEETTNPQEGSKALKVVVSQLGTNSWDVQSLGPTVSMTAASAYTLTFWAKAAVAGTQVRTVIQGVVYTAKSYTLSTTWTQYTWNFTAAEAAPSIRLQYFQTGTIWMDDIQLQEVIPHTGPYDITLTPATQHQTMVGFGGCLSWYADWVYNGTEANAAEIENLLYVDLGMDVLRLKNNYYPANYPTDKSSTVMWEKEHAAAKAANPDIQVLLSSWSPPANLKSNGERPNGGTLAKDGSGNFKYGEFAQYWVDLLDNLTWTPEYISIQNEPGYVATWDSCIFRPTETATNAGYVEAADAVWNAIKDRPNAPLFIGSEAENIGNSTWADWNAGNPVNTFEALNTPLLGKPYIGAHGYHLYNVWEESKIDSAETISSLNMIRDSFGDRPNWMTEFKKYGFIDNAHMIHNAVVEANCAAYICWSMVWQTTSSDAIIGIDNSGNYTVGDNYYTLKHYAKHIDKGYQRIEIGGSTADLKVSGYLSQDGTSITLVAINKSASPEQIDLVPGSLAISGVAGYQSVAANFYQTMTGLDAANSIDLPASSITTLVLTLSEPYDMIPKLAPSDIVDDKSGGPVTINNTVTYTVSFSEDMEHTTISAADFGNAGTASVSIGTITETSANSGVFTILVTPSSTGTLRLKVNAGAVLKDTTGNNLNTTNAILDLGSILVQSMFTAWSGGVAFDVDTNGDGVDNGMAWLLGAANKDLDAASRLPVASLSGGNLVLNFTCLKVANRGISTLKLQFSDDLGVTDPWTSHEAEVPDVSGDVTGVSFVTSANANPDLIDVQATILGGGGSTGRVFARLIGKL